LMAKDAVDAPKEVFKLAAETIHFSPSTDVLGEGVERLIEVSVTDSDDLKTTATTNFNVVINDIIEIQLLQDNFLGLGDDTLLIPDDLSSFNPVSGGDGFNTIKFNQDDMDLNSDEVQSVFASQDWDRIETIGPDDGVVTLRAEDVIAMSAQNDNVFSLNEHGDAENVLQLFVDDTAEVNLVDNDNSEQIWQKINDSSLGSGEALYQAQHDGSVAYVHVLSVNDDMPLINLNVDAS
jgi:hypothetical protein